MLPLAELTDTVLLWARTNLLDPQTVAQAGWVVFSLATAWVATRIGARRLDRIGDEQTSRLIGSVLHGVSDVLFPTVSLFLFWLYVPIARAVGLSTGLTAAAVTLSLAWIAIRLGSTMLVRRPRMARMLAGAAWGAAALELTGLLTPLLKALDALGVTVGETHVSVLSVLTGLVILGLFIAGANLLSRVAEKQINTITSLSPSMRVLFGKLLHIGLVGFAFLLGLNALGIDMTALTVFGGAVGVGLGFGLQKVVSNFISGIILLADRSIKPGDVIVVGQTYGWVKNLSARYVSLVTRDGKEHLIPNETLITERVENWSYSNNDVRMRIPVGVSYSADLRHALELMKEAAAECPRTLDSPVANALVTGFGDSAVNLELRVWINDPVAGMGNVQSDIYLRIWDKFREHDIEIPFPQRDVHIRGPVAWTPRDTDLPPSTATGSE
ncbi:MAG: mechanosensitive ion channel [Nitrospirota bacterium]|nr:mechanosensitive ion channel [Nitrospirota bacterium]